VKKLLFAGLMLSSSLGYSQGKNISAGIMAGAGYSYNAGVWAKVGKLGLEYVQGTANPSLVPVPTEYRNIGFNYFINKFFIGGGVQTIYDDTKSRSPYANFGAQTNFGYNDSFAIRGEVITGGVGYTTFNAGLGFNF
jgi:hypothetical protein